MPVNDDTPVFSELYLKDGEESRYSNPRAYHRIEGQYLYTWSELENLTSTTITGVPLRTGGGSQATAGYRELLTFERQLLYSRLHERILDDQDPEQFDNYDYLSSVIRDISQRSIEVGETITNDRPDKTELPSGVREMLNEHQYLLDPESDIQRRREAVEAALVSWSDEEETQIDYGGLDPRQGSQHRQYRFLASGEETDEKLTAPIGFV